MPKPRPTESKEKYMKRCIEVLVKEEGRSTDQAVAMCAAYWRESKKKQK